MNNLPIIVIGGEPNSVFSEIFVKSFKYSKKNKPIILFISYKLFLNQNPFLPSIKETHSSLLH